MPTKRHSTEQIISKLREVEIHLAMGNGDSKRHCQRKYDRPEEVQSGGQDGPFVGPIREIPSP